MRLFLFSIATAMAFMAVQPLSAQTPGIYNNPGPVISGSVQIERVPKTARDFINKHFRNAVVVKCEEDFMPQEYEIELSDGTDLEFDDKGQWIEIDAGKARVLPGHLVKKLLPRRAHDELSRRNVLGAVETLKRGKAGYKVELRGVELDDYKFDRDGKLLSISD